MKRITLIILIVAFALLVALGAWFVFRRAPGEVPTTANLVPEVSKFGTLTNLKDDKGRRLFSKPIQEGFYVRYRVGDGEGQLFYAIGDRVSNPKASYSGYQEKISGAGITTQNGLNVTSGFVIGKSKETLKAIRTIVNLSKENATMYLSEVNNYIDTNLLPLRTVIGRAKKVEPLPLRTVVGKAKKVAPLPGGIEMAIRSNLTDDSDLTDQNCWPCLPWPDCELEYALPDPTRATIICMNCKKDEGFVHVVCLAELDKELDEYRKQGCEHLITFTGIDARADKPLYDEDCSGPLARDQSPSVVGMPATHQVLSEADVKRALTLPARAAIVLITEYKIIRPSK